MLVTMLPLVILYWLSIGLAWIFRLRGDSGARAGTSLGRRGRGRDDDPDGSPRTPTPRSTLPAYPEAMLFDLRGRGRRRTVQVIYLSLAILMGGGLVLFGIGGATSGGLVDAITGSSDSERRHQRLRQESQDAPGAAEGQPEERSGARGPDARPGPAGLGHRLTTRTRAPTAQRDRGLQAAGQTWDRYLGARSQEPRRRRRRPDGLGVQLRGAQRPAAGGAALDVVIDARGGSAGAVLAARDPALRGR